jgi:hypothetical protein
MLLLVTLLLLLLLLLAYAEVGTLCINYIALSFTMHNR